MSTRIIRPFRHFPLHIQSRSRIPFLSSVRAMLRRLARQLARPVAPAVSAKSPFQNRYLPRIRATTGFVASGLVPRTQKPAFSGRIASHTVFLSVRAIRHFRLCSLQSVYFCSPANSTKTTPPNLKHSRFIHLSQFMRNYTAIAPYRVACRSPAQNPKRGRPFWGPRVSV